MFDKCTFYSHIPRANDSLPVSHIEQEINQAV